MVDRIANRAFLHFTYILTSKQKAKKLPLREAEKHH